MSSTGFNVDTRDLHFVLFEQLRIHETLADYDKFQDWDKDCLLYTSPSPRDRTRSRMPSSA